MGYLSERVSYLQGLADGLKLDEGTNEGKLLKAIIDVLDDMAISIEEIEDNQKDMYDDLDALDEQLEDLEDYLFDDDCDCDCDCDCDDDCCCCCSDDDCECSDLEDYAELECPGCGASIEIEKSFADECKEVLVCPSCKEEIHIEWLDDEDEE